VGESMTPLAGAGVLLVGAGGAALLVTRRRADRGRREH
jgi:LPXTG-motif cell wall-anchored protein